MSETANGNVTTGNESANAENQEVATASPAGENAAEQAPQRPASRMESAFAIIKSVVIRALIIYCLTSFFRSRTPTPALNTTGVATAPSIPSRNLFPDGTRLTLYVYISEDPQMVDFSPEKLFWLKNNLVYGDWTSGPDGDGTYFVEKDYEVTETLRNNGSLYLHAYLTKVGESPDPQAKNYAKNRWFAYVRKMLNKFKKLKASTTKNLLTGETEKEDVEDGKIISHWHPNMTLDLVTDQTAWTFGTVPSPLDEYILFTDDGKYYKPVLFANDFWNMAKDYKPLNETLRFRITYQPLSLFKWQLYAAQIMRQKWNVWGQSDDEQQNDDEQDTLKETLLETNPYLLGITLCVSILHSVFELLAFKNDIQFWNNRNSLEGLSVRSVFFGVFQSVVVLLYVLDNDTNMLIRISCFVGLGIELWKIQKVVDIKFENGFLRFKDKGSYVETSTKIYDQLAFKYLSWVCFPLLAGYSGYALLYLEHKGWYSFVLDLLYGYLLTFGFIMMTPQLFINYKLKSVAHLPWRMLTYKFLNTFIDDMFAFVIKMPTMYRLGCFRDDIIFLVFLYQRWIYPVDKTRRNEYGYAEEPQQEQAAIEDKKTQ